MPQGRKEIKMDIQNSIMELTLLSWRGGYTSGKIGGQAAAKDKERVIKLRDQLCDQVSSKDNLLKACQLAYRKHVLNDPVIGWDELGDFLLDAICNEIGDDGYKLWLQQVNSADKGC